MSTPDEPQHYWIETRRPLVNLAFIAPLLLAYEFGAWWSTSALGSARNGADEWLRTELTQRSGLWGSVVPLVVIGVFLAWQGATKFPWRVRGETLAGMTAESLLFACLLVLIGQGADSWMRAEAALPLAVATPGELPWVGMRLVHFLGAGIYEEFLFRLVLIPAVYVLLRFLLVPTNWSLAGSIGVTSLLFALAHYLIPSSDATLLSVFADAMARVQSSRELWFGFTFRGIAGLLFGALFVWRGFGVAVGCHAAYDVIVGIILVSEL
jgi:membrane protease YdiL (CAAX protease family)